jgi:hypothetical protein
MDNLAKEFAQAVRVVKAQTKEQERKEIEDWVNNCTERNLPELKKQFLELFKAYNHQQEMLEISMMQNLIGTYHPQDSTISFPSLEEE